MNHFLKQIGWLLCNLLCWAAVVAAVVKISSPLSTQALQYSKDQGYFYRLKAGFEIKDTGERVDFDYVVACNIRLTRWRSGGLSDDSSISPKAMVMATHDGHAVMVRTLVLCGGSTTDNGNVPPDVLPLAVWFDDVGDLSAGLGYLSEDAYDNPLGRLKFRGARVERATREDWEAWRAKSAAEYVQRGVLPGPWGYDFPNHTPPELGQYISTCETYRRLKLPENLRAKLRELWPQDRPRFWTVPSEKEWSTFRDLVWTYSRKFPTSGDLVSGQPLRSGQIVQIPPHVPSEWPSEMYPALWRGLASILPAKKASIDDESGFVVNLDYRNGAMSGFGACQDARDDATYTGVRAPASAQHVFQVDGLAVKQLDRKSPRMQVPQYFAERDEAVFIYGAQNF